MAMIYWQDKLVGFFAEFLRAVMLFGVPFSVLPSLEQQNGIYIVYCASLLLLSQITINGLRSPPPR
jgi:hypothetical protein